MPGSIQQKPETLGRKQPRDNSRGSRQLSYLQKKLSRERTFSHLNSQRESADVYEMPHGSAGFQRL